MRRRWRALTCFHGATNPTGPHHGSEILTADYDVATVMLPLLALP